MSMLITTPEHLSAVAGSLRQSDKKVTLHMKGAGCLEAIDNVLSIAGFKCRRKGRAILISSAPQEISTSGICDPDSRPRQVLIEGKVVEISESGMRELGIKWGKEPGVLKLAVNKDTGEIGLTEDLLATLKALAGEGKAEILAAPSIIALNGHEASINIGSRVPYATPASVSSTTTYWSIQYIDAGVSLKINPKVEDDGSISVSIKPEVSSISEWRTTSAGEFPVITTRNAESIVRVNDGETIVIGGLINKSDRENTSKVAILGDIPFLGGLFQNKVTESTKTEVIFLVTPKVI